MSNGSNTSTAPQHEPVKTRSLLDGIQKTYWFDNGYGASVVRHKYSYGYQSGLWELAVLGQDGHLTYETPITDDVIGHLSDEEVESTLDQIAALPKPVTQ